MARQTLLSTQGQVGPTDSKSVKTFSFDVPAGVETLALKFNFGPRKATDRERNASLVEAALKKHNERRKAELDAAGLEEQRKNIGAHALYRELNNLMNVVLIDPAGNWRGRWDRNPSADNGDLVLTRRESSPGFIPGDITPGKWTAAVECHGIFGENVRFELEVATRGALEETERTALLPVKGVLKEPKPKKRSGPGWYFGELHSHTTHSDGKHDLPELMRRAHELGIDFLCLTDHNTTSGLLDPGELPITLVPGCELTTFHGHHPIYGFTDIIPWHKEGRVRKMEEMAPEIRGKGGVVSVAHPFKIGDPICTGCRMRDDLPPESFDLMEVWYRAWDAAETDNLTAYALWNSYWANGHRVTAVAARDWHGPGQEAPWPGAAPFTAIWADDNTPEAIVEGMKRGRILMSGGPILDLAAEANGQRAFPGGALKATTADLVVTASKHEGPVQLRLFKNGERRMLVDGFDNGERRFSGFIDGPGWYRAETWSGDKPRVITNHVVVER